MDIVIIGDLSSTNLGDPILTLSTGFEIKEAIQNDLELEIELFDIADRKATNIIQTSSIAPTPNIKPKSQAYWQANIKSIIKWIVCDRKAFYARLKKLEKRSNVIFCIAGGALISKSVFYGLRLNAVIEFAKKNNCNVVFNSIGIEKQSTRNISFWLAKKYINRRNVIAFATRDHLEELKKLTKRQNFFNVISDPGIFAAECFGITKKCSDVVGIGVISEQAYKSVAGEEKMAQYVVNGYGEGGLIEFWLLIIEYLEKRQIKWKVFTNGGMADYELALKLIERGGYAIEEKLVERPVTPQMLVEQISSFKMVMAHRLHALIIASSLKIPVIAITWSDKVVKYSEKIGNPFVFWPETKAAIVVAKLLAGEIPYYEEYEKNIQNCKKEALNYIKRSIGGD